MLKVVLSKSRIPSDCLLFLQPAHSSLLPLILFFIISHCSHLTASAQMGVRNGGSPLYNSRPYSTPAPSGLLATGKYGAVVMNMIRLGGIATVVAMLTLLLLLRRRGPAATGAQAGATPDWAQRSSGR